MEVKWLAGWVASGYGRGFRRTHLFLLDGDVFNGPFCTNLWHYLEWKEDPNPETCEWCLEAERWLRLVDGEPLDVLKRIPGYKLTVRKHPLEVK